MKATLINSWFSVITIPTHFTLLRIFLIPFIASAIISQSWLMAIFLFVLASLTDLIDGALARFLNQVSLLGSLLDPLADKLLLITSFGCFALFYPSFNVPLWLVLFMIINELVLVAFALYWGVYKHSISIKPTRLGRLVSFGQLLVIGWLMLAAMVHKNVIQAQTTFQVSPGLFYLLVGLVLLSRLCVFLDYCFRAWGKVYDE